MIFETLVQGFDYLNSVMIVLLKERKKEKHRGKQTLSDLQTLNMLTKENKPSKRKCLFG